MRVLAQLPPGSWAVVMGCGIVSIDLLTIGAAVLSAAVAWLAIAVWLVLVLKVARLPRQAVAEARYPAVLGSAAATAVLGARAAAAGDAALADGLLVLAVLCLLVLVLPVRAHWQTPATGTSFLVSVAVQGVAALSATLAVTYRASWLLGVAVAAWAVGLVIYVAVARQFDLGSVGTGPGDHWVAGGALAIATLAAGKIAVGALALADFARWRDVFIDSSLAVWCLAMAWFIVLIAAELARPRLGYDVRRWATVFPVGMYAACSFVVGNVTGIGGITDFARLWTWAAVLVTLVVLVGLTRRAITAVRAPPL